MLLMLKNRDIHYATAVERFLEIRNKKIIPEWTDLIKKIIFSNLFFNVDNVYMYLQNVAVESLKCKMVSIS